MASEKTSYRDQEKERTKEKKAHPADKMEMRPAYKRDRMGVLRGKGIV